MDHSVNAKVIITLLDLYFFTAFFQCTLQTHTYTDRFTRTHTHTQKVFSDEQAAWGGVRGLTEWPSF